MIDERRLRPIWDHLSLEQRFQVRNRMGTLLPECVNLRLGKFLNPEHPEDESVVVLPARCKDFGALEQCDSAFVRQTRARLEIPLRHLRITFAVLPCFL